jgi:hypothetical protein
MDKKLIVCFVALVVLLAVLGGVTVTSFRSMRTAFDSGLLVEKQEEVRCAVEVAYAVIARTIRPGNGRKNQS